MSLPKLILIMTFVFPLTLKAQLKIQEKDSVELKKQIEGFYTWYIDLIKNNKVNKDFNPTFVRQETGMTTLDFKKYTEGLKKFNFATDFIERKINDFNDCVKNLNKIPFDTFSKYQDLDDFENINCDFSNSYEWTGGMDPKDKAELSSLKSIDKSTIVGNISFISNLKTDGMAIVTFKKTGQKWKIDNLELSDELNDAQQ